MATHYVKCLYCKKYFNRDAEPFVKVNATRYAHKICAEHPELIEKTQEEKDLEALEEYIKKLFKEDYVNPRIRKQINNYKKDYNYTYSGILNTLIYWFEIKGNLVDNSKGGIGIVPYIYKEAKDYYYNLYLNKFINHGKNIEEYKPKIKHIEIFAPKNEPKKIKLFNLEDEE